GRRTPREAVECALRMAELQSKRRDPVELAPDPAATRACAVRGRARGRASRRAQSLATFLGAGGEAVSGPRRGPSRPLGVVDAARIAARAARRGPRRRQGAASNRESTLEADSWLHRFTLAVRRPRRERLAGASGSR